MRRNFLIALAIVAIVFVGIRFSPVSALTVDEIQTQIRELLAKVADLKKQLNELRTKQNPPPNPSIASETPFKHRICYLLYRNLALGQRGDDVRAVQEFLNDEGYLSANATGYFGSLTAQAVARWQASQGVSPVGHFGPMSRERIKIWCGGKQGDLKASPSMGAAPLSVYFWYILGGNSETGYSIDFGDGTSGAALDVGCGVPPNSMVGACPRALTASHTYTSDGVYTATLYKTVSLCPPNIDPNGPRCLAPIQREIIDKVQITVGPIACTKEYKPVCGLKSIVCITTPCNPIPTTYGNRCEMNADGANFLYEGQCKTSYKNPENDPMCKAWNDGISCGGMSCGRDVPGGTPSCGAGNCYPTTPQPAASWRCTAWFDNSGNKPPVISGFSGPTTLTVNQAGTWSIKASDPENGQLTYQVWWGDEHIYSPANASTVSAREFVQSTTFTHTYANAGTYTVSVVVSDSGGQEAKTSTTVKVGSDRVVCTMEYAPVCGQPPFVCNAPQGAMCAQVMPAPKTYSNRCMMNGDGASFLYEGACQPGWQE